ncbi:MAG: 7-cyano-7-deazaguanine synthase QueC [Thermoplasmatales archaeon]|nr:MAG: 7-cyano-7-deazaguanine synthase QueC [Thermoplasmatales archaeon]
MAKKAVSLISGGLDSCVTSFIAKEQGYGIYAISFRYGQLHKKELECSNKIARAVGAEDHVILDVDLQKFSKSSLLNKSANFIQDHGLKEIGKEIPSTYVPARNTVFLSLALAYAESIEADAIFIGANAVDYSAYPDCRPEYIHAYQKMADVATKIGAEGRPIKIEAPLLRLPKSEIIKIGLKLKAPLADTWSCYRGGEKACGRCDSCLLRLKGFKEAEAKDPMPYEYYPDWYTS